ncbi:vacuolar ABC heavy metal transporter [Niveomyces insectorum RCEF 264]|uniref:Vacuolar ABC heavy metal transporter n=1 Tax=Niveomyces insectorum RCEF 264 TaxID=1081102 RepID=A0A162J8V0_9HYPO|nr:vacuolar ABC heavy metal transporter [Niveomyces insectorum RCEF 264]
MASLVLLQSRPLDTALTSLHYIYPATVFGYFVVSSSVAICTLSDKREHRRRRPILLLMLFSVLSYLAQIAAILIPSLVAKEWTGQQDAMISLLSCILVFGIQLAVLSDDEEVTWYRYIGSYLLALVFEPALETVALFARTPGPLAVSEIVQLSIVASRYLAIGLLVATYFTWRNVRGPEEKTDSERQPLIPKDANGTPIQPSGSSGNSPASSTYGSTSSTTATAVPSETASADSSAENSDSESSASETRSASKKKSNAEHANESNWERRQREAQEEMEKRLKENGNWFDYAKRFVIFFPYIWPVGNRALQLRAVLVGVCLLANNALNVLIPRQLGIIMDSLGHVNNKNPWVQVLIFAGLKFSASEAGLSLLRQWLWIPVEFYSFGAMSTAAYSHVLNLSSDFHDSKSSSDIMMAISSGQSISNLLESICFSAIPMLIDMSVAFVYLSATFGPYEGFITFATAIIFLYIAGRMIAGLKVARRGEVNAWFEEHYVRQAGIQGWSTVASFNQVSHEEQRYSKAVKNRVARSQAVYLGYLTAYAFQYLVLLAGLLAGAFLAVWQVTSGQSTPGQFIMLLTYWTQLVAPLTFFASLGKNVSRNFIQAEALLEIMKTKPTIINKENAPELQFSGGAVEFKNVSFSYNDKKDILKNVTFSAPSGMTFAFVGATGAGKSTILKLLDRFYDVTEGSILIDGQDVRDVDLFSLRSRIGIVPQAPILFNDTVLNNVRYARLDATDEDVYEACKAAAIHDQILGFSDGYDTRVGERGVKLSGGELQRVAIARAILKKPSIVLLDEATSAVDTETEHKIQEALHTLCSGRTTFVVAHRLSTVMNADCIIVVSDGEIVEQGSHDDLIQAGGKYASLWSKQIFSKPKDKNKASTNATTDTSEIVNDLTPEATKNELAKVQKNADRNTDDSDGNAATIIASVVENNTRCEAINDTSKGQKNINNTKKENDKNDENNFGKESATEVETSAERKKEETRLNPVAPPFTPLSFSGAILCNPTRHSGTDSENTDAGFPPSVLAVCSNATLKPQVASKKTYHDGDAETGIDSGGSTSAISSRFSRIPKISSSCVSDQSGSEGEPSSDQQRSTDATEFDSLDLAAHQEPAEQQSTMKVQSRSEPPINK